jgi:hypothetical protein
MTEEVWNKGNHEIMDELFSADVVWHFLPDGSKTTSLEELRDHVFILHPPEQMKAASLVTHPRGSRFM